ncbi:bifunctional ADP-heptose synthase [Flavobacteriales bacterium]|nr:bifunctional ADP-heptose synthase [Flavobacteriales bacterium]
MDTFNWKSVFDKFEKIKVLIVGDAMIDAYMWGNINRQSPEAPIPIVDITTHEKRLGGAANVAINIKALGAEPILCSVIGNDKDDFFQLMKTENLSTNGILTDNRKTTIKTRVISEGKHQLRIDEEDTFPIKNENEFITNTIALMRNVDVVIFQDYNKGVLTQKVIDALITESKKLNKLVLVDPKKDNYWSFKNVDLFKPNLNELNHSSKKDFDATSFQEINNEVSAQRQKLNANYFMLTLSQHGVLIQDEKNSRLFPVFERNVIDVSGAGDCVIATASLALASGLSTEQIAQLSNLAGGLSCEKVGVNPVEKENLLNEAIRLI